MRQLLRRVWFLLRHRRLEADLAEELAFHAEMKRRELRACGIDEAEARFATNRALGSVALAQDRSHDVWLPHWLHGTGHDLRLACRALRATPSMTAVAILSLALGIGANSAIFSIVSSLLLRPLPVADPERLTLLTTSTSPTSPPDLSFATFEALKLRAHFVESGLAFSGCCGQATLDLNGAPYTVNRQFVSGDFFDTLGIGAVRGRVLRPADNAANPPDGPVAVMSYRFWRALGSPETAIGAQVTVDHIPFTLIGVTPPTFFGVEVGRSFDLAVPLRLNARLSRLPLDDNSLYLHVILRLKPHVSMEAAVSGLRAVQPQIRQLAMPTSGPSPGFLAAPLALEPITNGVSPLRARFARPLLVILAIVVLVLLVACANIANLFLARALRRSHELAIRMALGASRWRLVRPLLVEALVVSVTGAALGLLCASRASRLLVAGLSTAHTPIVLDTVLDWRVLVFTTGVTLGAAVLFSAIPAARTTRVVPFSQMLPHTQRSIRSLSGSLLAGQLALALLLVVSAALFIQTVVRLATVPTGLTRQEVLVATVGVSKIPFVNRLTASQAILHAVQQLPGVGAAGASFNPPMVGMMEGNLVVSPLGTTPPRDAEQISRFTQITPGWLNTYGVPLHAGRDFTERDTVLSPRVMIVNDSFARHFLADRPAVGSTLTLTLRAAPNQVYGDYSLGPITIVGVVGDTVYRSLRDSAAPAIYVAVAQFGPTTPFSNLFVSARPTAGSAALLQRPLASAISRVNPDAAVAFQTLAQEIDESLIEDRVTAVLSGCLGGLAVVLAMVGVYGTTAYAVGQRQREIGIRVALGAMPAAVMSLIFSHLVRSASAGLSVGVVISLWLSRFVTALLYGVQPYDPATIIGAVAVLVTVAAFAGWLPARRASRIDPAAVLREQ